MAGDCLGSGPERDDTLLSEFSLSEEEREDCRYIATRTDGLLGRYGHAHDRFCQLRREYTRPEGQDRFNRDSNGQVAICDAYLWLGVVHDLCLPQRPIDLDDWNDPAAAGRLKHLVPLAQEVLGLGDADRVPQNTIFTDLDEFRKRVHADLEATRPDYWQDFWSRFQTGADRYQVPLEDLRLMVLYWEHLPTHFVKAGDHYDKPLDRGRRAAGFIARAANKYNLNGIEFMAAHRVFWNHITDCLPIWRRKGGEPQQRGMDTADFEQSMPPEQELTEQERRTFQAGLDVLERFKAALDLGYPVSPIVPATPKAEHGKHTAERAKGRRSVNTDLLSVQEVADVCGKSKGRISQLCKEGKITYRGKGPKRKVSLVSAQAHFARTAREKTSKSNATLGRDARKDARELDQEPDV